MVIAVRDDVRAPMRASTVAAAAEGAQAADLPTGRFNPPPPLIFDPLLPIDPRRLAEINAGGPGGSMETAQAMVVHPTQRRRVELSRFALYPLPSSEGRIRTEGATAGANCHAFTETIADDHKIFGIGYSPSKVRACPSSPPR
jgi:hypothetical protein